jgi:lipid-binding SYLF domain-containing protein
LVVPTINKTYVVENNTTGGQSIVVKTSAGTGITVPNGRRATLYVDGTNVVGAFDYLNSLTLGTALPIASGGTGATTIAGAQTNLEVDPAGTAVAMAIALG